MYGYRITRRNNTGSGVQGEVRLLRFVVFADAVDSVLP